jgi:2-polyprenyl-6-methoxyphenol hydroxylase-like FAD-dependent oxidoreductase
LDFAQGEDEVSALALNLESGQTLSIFARYLVGCDGARSDVRCKIGIKLSGDPKVIQVQSRALSRRICSG